MGLHARFTSWWRRPGRIAIARWERATRKGERYVAEYEFPAHLERRVGRHDPCLSDNWTQVERGLREWFVCCAWRGETVLGMPSRAVDEAWHEFILDSIAYTRFCNAAFGSYLHHTPDEAMSAPMPPAVLDTVRAWDRSDASAQGEATLWDLDRHLGLAEPLGVSTTDLHTARNNPATASTPPFAAHASSAGGGGCGTSDGGDSGGCGGGSCGGGGS